TDAVNCTLSGGAPSSGSASAITSSSYSSSPSSSGFAAGAIVVGVAAGAAVVEVALVAGCSDVPPQAGRATGGAHAAATPEKSQRTRSIGPPPMGGVAT